ncbi:DUF3298 and DUF4163 domain-containing protein [Acetivibrio straminisolvens]|jgi:hypothetical protein|uniref:DUF3298 and DUF4163 domain-containing protein n=1 Tax=Acetivibrio straminisolvens TaxID=253314 RepID=UPI00223EFFE8|nr:DUF3298 and DUF4163 domain-containing protein [Acetivibrio straminisolvens]
MNNIQNPVYIFTRRIVSPHQDLIIDYPFVTGFKTLAVQNSINSRIINTVNELIYEQTGKLLDQGYKAPQMTIQGWYEIKTNEKGVLSLSIGNYTIAYPAAHGLTIIKSLTFDIDTGKEYNLEELFKPGSDYVGILSKIIEKQIKEREIPILGEFKGIRRNQDYYIADKALVIYFQLYEITPYAFGFPMFPISVYEIQDIIREGSPLSAML